MTDVLENAVWHALANAHQAHAEANGAALRYDPDVSVFHAIDEPTTAAWHDLESLATNGHVVLFRETPVPEPPSGWKVVVAGQGHQMVRTRLPASMPALPGAAVVRALTDDDVPAMTDLVARTEPGPFRPRTIELGGYLGIFHGTELVAMAGTRLAPPGYVEVSAVCVDPTARRRGYASIVSHRVAEAIAETGLTPMLHVADDNDAARKVYEQLGFVTRRMCGFTVLGRPRSPA